MRHGIQKMVSMTKKQETMLKRMAYESGMSASKIIQTMIEIVNQSDNNLSMIKAAAKAEEGEKRHLHIMSDRQKKAPTYEFEDDAKPGDTGFNNTNNEPEESLEELQAKL